ncbi:GNAT family N-acetyltransferase [Caulobacter sp. KR2-114]|uniref:GNAT family N-acetyltransferase n=1 Tax=Caulobacter sp. KR2-114 TaxID=3400912 RepID=UPI003C1176DE
MPEETPPLDLPERLTDGVVMLDGHVGADAAAHHAGEDAEMRRRFHAPRPATLQEIRAAVQRWVDALAAPAPTRVYALRDGAGVLMGGAEARRTGASSADVSYWIYPAFRGRGLAARALALLVDALGQSGIATVEAHIDPDNLASRRTAERAGFEEAGLVTETEWTGETVTRVRYVRGGVTARR